ncbi:DUF6571 family protein [Streptomyces sp. HB2AG]|uniref:DUF6571 family protein n=1 Tax=Streptomyces sp. HB2AG TaxID=2983400 RepID=UPI0022AA2D7F|nr:DUF6571 family protein [Streptomyces sp. HB2AG]MCZ2524821.1 hypothetical protein [Streptomyces sp. HB2AG]
MLNYEDVVESKPDTLATAADKWREMAKKFKELEARYAADVQSIFTRQEWIGSAAGSAQMQMAGTRRQLADAQAEAKAVAALLDDAHADFTAARNKVKTLGADANASGMRVTGAGNVGFDSTLVSPDVANAMRRDPDLREIESSWREKIRKALQEATDADEGARMALSRAAKVGDESNTFNHRPVDDIDTAEAERASELATRLASGKDLSSKETAELQRLLDHNAGNERFSQQFLGTMGPENTLRMSNRLSEGAYGKQGKDGNTQYAAIEDDLARTLATATRNTESPFYDKWTDGMREIGTKNLGSNTEPMYGYQCLATLMQNGDGYSSGYLNDLGNDIIAAEKKRDDMWSMPAATDPWLEIDPLDGVLGVMSKNPDAATTFLDPEAEGGNERLEYLLKDRDWPSTYYAHQYGIQEFDDPTSRMGLGLAIEAASTGAEPGKETGKIDGHTPGQARVMQETIQILDSDGGGDDIHHNMHAPIARALSDYVEDTHNIIAGGYSGYNSPEGRGSIWIDDGKGRLAVGEGSLIRVMRGVSDQEVNYALLYESERFYAAQKLADAPEAPGNANEHWEVPARETANVLGTFNAIGADVILDDRDDRKQWADDVAKYAYHGAGAPVTELMPVLGDTAQRIIDSATYEWAKDVKAAADAEAGNENSGKLSTGVAGTNDLIDRWAEGREMDPDHDSVRQIKQESEQSYITSRESAFTHLHRD